jgi:hypothetical protein
MVTSVNMAFYWDVAVCDLVDVDRYFRGAYCLLCQGDEYPDDGDSNLL